MQSAMTHITVTQLRWHDASATKPDTDRTVLCVPRKPLLGEWFAGWWDAQAGAWFDCASGGIVDGVTWWADPEVPT